MAELPPPPHNGPNKFRAPLSTGQPQKADLPAPPPEEPKATKPQGKDKGKPESPFGPEALAIYVRPSSAGMILGPVDETVAGTTLPSSVPAGQILGPSAPDAPKTVEQHEGRQMSNEEYAEAQWVKESMWRYENRPRGRSSQAHLGPSELGSACDRKLVYRLTGTKPFAHGSGANWPAIVGTGIHSWMEGMLKWLDQDRGRFLIEHGVTIIEGEVAGTLDVYDRLQKRVRDWKFPGARAVRKYRLEGVGDQYRTQGQIYALGLAMQGETPKDIAIDMIARDAASVDQGIHVEIFPYLPSKAHEAVAKYKRLKELSATVSSPLDVKATPSGLCAFCPFYAPGVKGACDGTDAGGRR